MSVSVVFFILMVSARARDVAVGASLFVSGRATGCSLTAAVNPLGPDLMKLRGEILRGSSWAARTGDLVLWKTPDGEYWAPPSTDVPFLLAEKRLDLYGARHPQHGIRPGDVVVDCGANIGTFTRLALEAGAGRVVAIEVSPRNLQCLRRNFEGEIEAGSVIVVAEGVWHEDGTLELATFDNSVLDSLVMRQREETPQAPTLTTVRVTRLDTIVERLGLDRIDFIKMDIEGAERNALVGAHQTLTRFHPRMALAAENLLDDVEVLPQKVAEAAPGYEMRAGPCRSVRSWSMRPEVLHFF